GRLLQHPGAPVAAAPRPRVVTLLCLGEPPAWERVVTETERAAARFGPTALVAAPADAANGGEAVAGYGRMLDDLESSHDLVLLVCPRGAPDAWREFRARQADRLVAIAPAGDAPPPPAAAPAGDCDVLLVRDARAPATVATWLDALHPRAHHLVDARDGHLVDGVRRAVRRVLGRSLGVVLSGGGARAFAHLGRLLVDGGVLNTLPIDVMAATGEGPVIAIDAMDRRLERGRRAVQPPSITEVLARSAMLSSVRAAGAHRARAQLVIAPDVGAAGLLEFARLDGMVDAGRRAADAQLEDALALAG